MVNLVNNRPKVKKKIPASRQYSVCTYCRYGIFAFNDCIWTCDGLIHTWCVRGGLDETQDDP